MRTVIYSMSVSLDGFIAGPGGDIGWTTYRCGVLGGAIIVLMRTTT